MAQATTKQILRLDRKRRIALPKDIPETYGERFVMVRLRDEILLKPLPRDPLKALMAEGKKLKGLTAQRFEKEIERRIQERI